MNSALERRLAKLETGSEADAPPLLRSSKQRGRSAGAVGRGVLRYWCRLARVGLAAW